MADILPQSPSSLRISPPSSPLQLPMNGSEVTYVDAREQPHDLSLVAPPPTVSAGSDGQINTLRAPRDEESFFNIPRGHSRKHKSLALPTFSFNPGAALDDTSENTSPPVSPHSPGLPVSPSKRKHRRIHSELVGGDSRHQSPVASTGANVDKITDELVKRDILEPIVSRTPSKGHRHRRSGAVSSRDLSAVQRPSSSSTTNEATSASGPPTPTFGSQFPSANDSPRNSPVHVSFSDNHEVAARQSLPTLKGPDRVAGSRPIHSSDGAESRFTLTPSQYLESIRPATVATAPTRTPFSMMEPASSNEHSLLNQSVESLASVGEFPSVSIVEQANDEAPPSLMDGEPSLLDENFDNDPTAAIVVPENSTTNTSSPRSPTFGFDNNRSPDSTIDLDSANDVVEATSMTAEDLRNLRAKSFSAARHSMHSGGADAAITRLNHRRTESVPSMSMTPLERPPMLRNQSQTASERGFEIGNVFEEDEEDVQAPKYSETKLNDNLIHSHEQYGLGLDLEYDTTDEAASVSEDSISAPADLAGRELDDEHDTPTPTNDSDIPSRSQTIRNVSSNRHSLARSIEEPTFEEPHLTEGQRPVSQPLPSLTAPSWNARPEDSSFGSTPKEQSASSAWSTPKLETAATSLHEAHLGLPRPNADGVSLSSEGVPSGIPSLVSSMSTMSVTHRYAGSTTSPSTPGGTQAENSTTSISSHQDKRRKRSSIQSLSQLLGYASNGKSNLSVEQSSRCQTSSGLSNTEAEPTSKEKRRKRLSRALKFWKPKDGASSG